MSTQATTNNSLPIETKFSEISLKTNNKKLDNDQPLRRSTYNIFDAYDNNIPQNTSNSLDSYSIHPLETVSDGYYMDLAPNQPNQEPQAELNTMMKDLSLAPNNNILQRQRSMPYCV